MSLFKSISQLMLVGGLLTMLPIQAQAVESSTPLELVAGEVLVQVQSTVTADEVQALAQRHGATLEQRLTSYGVYLLSFETSTPVGEMVQRLEADRRVAYAEPNLLFHVNGLSTQELAAAAAGQGSKVIVAVLDTGMDFSHSAIAGNHYTNDGEIAGDGIDNDGNGYVDDVHGYDFIGNDGNPEGTAGAGAHGTQVAGRVLAGAQGANVEIMSLKVGPGPSLSLSAILQAIDYAIDNGAHIINMSFGGAFPSFALQEALTRAHNAGVMLVAAAGNDGRRVQSYPAAYDNVLSVGATNDSGRKAFFSNYGPWVDVMAPGQNVVVPTFGGGTAVVNGTSFSAPFVAGVLAMLKSADPSLTQEQAFARMVSLSKDVDARNFMFYRGQLGEGFVDGDVARALKEAFPPVDAEPEDPVDPPAGDADSVRAQLEAAELAVTQLESDLETAEAALQTAKAELDAAQLDVDAARDNALESQRNIFRAFWDYVRAFRSRDRAQITAARRAYFEALRERFRAARAQREAEQVKRQKEALARQAQNNRDSVADQLASARSRVDQLKATLEGIEGVTSAQAAAAQFRAKTFLQQRAWLHEQLQASPFAGLGVQETPMIDFEEQAQESLS